MGLDVGTLKKHFSTRKINASVNFKVPITPKNVFHLVQSLYGIGKNAAKIFAFG